ncbi:hypothetical protein CFHF_13240 [Caulobacter flavus]|uniref:Recombinase zinc beta ribbon domain-containing protein n=1 Tax=Caulobacter flavus TaxID=1679497 RepID=A0A2N5CTC8_9CAUL|nr:recombinase zinc beta ribbon domain-containing protein [Caulobacter flavus]AYV49273.1 hypothetical protein C1707_25185 [Caulobacter flavus]PLR14919.1 hypothetical protein CFHF_13240 [Caulobacter flavus]
MGSRRKTGGDLARLPDLTRRSVMGAAALAPVAAVADVTPPADSLLTRCGTFVATDIRINRLLSRWADLEGELFDIPGWHELSKEAQQAFPQAQEMDRIDAQLKNPDTGRVTTRLNPESDWVHVSAPYLRIVSDELWQAARAQQDSLVGIYEANIAKGEGRAMATVRRPKNLLSGLLVCGVCGGSYAKRSNDRFACVSHTMGTGCTNARSVLRDVLESAGSSGPEGSADDARRFGRGHALIHRRDQPP